MSQVNFGQCGVLWSILRPNKNSMEILETQKSSHLINHSLSHFPPVLVREDQEHFNRSILPRFFCCQNGKNLRHPQKSAMEIFAKKKKKKLQKNLIGQGKPTLKNHPNVKRILAICTLATSVHEGTLWHQLASKSLPWKVLSWRTQNP